MQELLGLTLNNRYFLRSKVGEGVYSSVYLAWDLKRKTDLAIKILEIQSHDNRLVNDLRIDINRLKALNHPNVIRYYDLDVWNRYPVIIMNYIEGNSIEKCVSHQTGVMDRLKQILGFYYQLCNLMEYTHSKGVVHAHLKPSNILIQNNNLYVSDFLFLRTLWKHGYIKIEQNNLSYIAPEVLHLNSFSIQSDIYSLGVILYQLLTDAPQGQSLTSVINQLASKGQNWEAPGKLSMYPEPIAKQLVFILNSCLDADLSKRFSSAMTLYGLLESVANQSQLIKTTDNYGFPKPSEAKYSPCFQDRKALPTKIRPAIATFFFILLGVIFGVFALNTFFTTGRPPNPAESKVLTMPASVNVYPSSFPLQITPLDLCQDISFEDYENVWARECITGVQGFSDGKFSLFVSLTALIPDSYSLTIYSDIGNTSIYVLDDQGQTYHHLEVGGEFNTDKTIKNGESKVGWYLFPPLSASARQIFFHDDDNRLVFSPILVPGR